ncbi:hypothetical protein EJV47_24895 [Hymenobacter gummosus]|uniref:Uncharacterized protein n=1 Tax=Hymenobacter gummosus TaxID=1776032 RepID=A0A431TVN0_9BACT|nr:hypothetical protein [Hymenobacter gummosus]RTQ45382.1 hypothetical protein EJV47_24895 [Hymenobacter gummosus]
MEVLLIAFLILTLYVGLIWVTARVLPAAEASRQWLAGAYWSSTAFVLVCWLAYVLFGWVLQFPTLFITAFISSGVLAGVRSRLDWVPARHSGWMALHCWGCLPVALGLWWALAIRYEPVYRDGSVAVEVSKDFTLSDEETWTLTFHQNRTALFEVETGRARVAVYDQQVYWQPEWWREVYRISLDPGAGRATLHRCCGKTEMTISYHAQ